MRQVKTNIDKSIRLFPIFMPALMLMPGPFSGTGRKHCYAFAYPFNVVGENQALIGNIENILGA